MFENLTDKLQRAFKHLRGQGTLTEENIAEALREIRVALLEADVNLNVARDLIEHIREKAVGTEVLTALSPSEQVIKIVRDELIALLGKDTARFKFASQPPTVILMAGLQGSGKTTTSGKLAAWLKKGGHRPMLVSVDVYRPAAREQLRVVAKSIEAKLYEGDLKGEAAGTALVERLAKEARREATIMGCDTLIVDTAGRLHIDEELMTEMERLKKLLNPSGDSLHRRRHDRPGRGQLRAGFSQASGPHRRRAHQNGWRCARRRGVVDSPCDGAAHQVHRRGRKARCLRALSSRPHRRPHPRHGRHDVADREGRVHARSQEERGVRQESAARRRLHAGRFSRPAKADQEAWLDGGI